MPLERVRIENLRCIEAAELALSPQRNYIYGPNGAGKTSLLEGIYLLGRGRSFRTRQNRRLIRHGQDSLTVFGESSGSGHLSRLALRLGSGGLESRIDGVVGSGVAELARRLPVNVIEPNIHQLIEGGPSKRRRFLDWGVFHVEQGFLDDWRRYRRALGQRNAALKQGQAVAPWDPAVVEAGQAVHAARRRYFDRLAPVVEATGQQLMARRLTLSYRSGWSRDLSFPEALSQSAARDRAFGATQVGPHRAELGVAMDDRGVREEASRGQQKLVAAALILSQVQVFAEIHGHGGVLLVDDPAAELDRVAFGNLMAALDALPVQSVLTGLSDAALPPVVGSPVFHVEQGRCRGVL